MTPKLMAIPFGRDGNKNTIYETRQQGQAENEATWSTGFPPITMQSKNDGGLPPLGLDFNGIFFDISENTVYQCMGGQYHFDAEYAEKINGYPEGAILLNDTNDKQYISLTDNNKTNFNVKDEDWAIISIAGIDELLAGKVGNVDLSNALNLKADKDRQIVAGNGLTGGGTLEQNRTLTLGTPNKISATSKNEVTQSSHSHAIDQASLTQKGITQLTSTLSDREDLSATPKIINEVNRKAVNAEKIGTNADAKAVAAQTKANQVPNPLLDQLPIGASGTAYKLITLADLKTKLGVPAKTNVVQTTGTSTTAVMSQKAVTDAVNALNVDYALVDFGTITSATGIHKKANPFGNIPVITIAEIKLGDVWTQYNWFEGTASGQTFGITSGFNGSDLVIRVGSRAIVPNVKSSSALSTDVNETHHEASAPARMHVWRLKK